VSKKGMIREMVVRPVDEAILVCTIGALVVENYENMAAGGA
jgi:hypothetical protein